MFKETSARLYLNFICKEAARVRMKQSQTPSKQVQRARKNHTAHTRG